MMPRLSLTLLLSTFLILPALTAQEPAAEAKTAEDPKKFNELIMEAQQLHAQQQFFDALQKLNVAEETNPQNPITYNVRGSIYTAMRDFTKAKESFKKSGELSPGAFEPKFNLAEIEFVEQNYAAAEAGFSRLLTEYPKTRQEVRHLTLFKVIVCQLKLGKITEAEHNMKDFTFMDDTPAYYYAQAALAFHKGNAVESQDWLSRAGKIYKEQENMPYLDSLIEVRWIPSIVVPDNAVTPPVGEVLKP